MHRLTHPFPIPRSPPTAVPTIFTLGMPIQVFGTRKSPDTRAALRFFAERRSVVHFVDLMERAASPGELRRFGQKFGVARLIDRDSRRFAELGLRSAGYGDERWIQLLADEPLVLRQPLVRNGSDLTVGSAADTWKDWTAK